MIELIVFASLAYAMQQSEQTFTPCPKTAGVPIKLTVKQSPAPMLECPLLARDPINAVVMAQAAACTFVYESTATVVLPVGPAVVSGLTIGMSPSMLAEHEYLHALQRMTHFALLPFGDHVCAE